MGYIALRTPRDVGALIRDARKRAKLGQAELATRIGVSRKWVVDAERGNPAASLGIVLRALDVLSVELVVATPSTAQSSSRRPSPTEAIEAIEAIDIDAIIEAARKPRR